MKRGVVVVAVEIVGRRDLPRPGWRPWARSRRRWACPRCRPAPASSPAWPAPRRRGWLPSWWPRRSAASSRPAAPSAMRSRAAASPSRPLYLEHIRAGTPVIDGETVGTSIIFWGSTMHCTATFAWGYRQMFYSILFILIDLFVFLNYCFL